MHLSHLACMILTLSGYIQVEPKHKLFLKEFQDKISDHYTLVH